MFRGLKTVALFIGGVLSVLLVLGTLMGAAGWFVVRHCADRLHECYVATRIPDSLKRLQIGALTQFAASSNKIAFPIALNQAQTGLLVFDRQSVQAMIISQKGFDFSSPGFSADGDRLILIRHESGTARREILSCLVSAWRCTVLIRTDYALRSPVDIEGGGILYGASPAHVVDNRVRFSDWDFYYLKPGSDPVRMSDLKLIDLYSINVVKDNIIFSAFDLKMKNPVLQKSTPISSNWSKIYSVKFDRNVPRIAKPSGPLSPRFLIGGFSNTASMSANGRWAAVENTEEGCFKYRFDLVLAKQDGSVDRRIILTGLGFSPGAFVGDTLVFNELFENRYDLRFLDLGTGLMRTIAVIDRAPEKLRSLQRIDLKISGEQYAGRALD